METVKHKNWSAKLWNFAALLTQIFTLTVPEKVVRLVTSKKKETFLLFKGEVLHMANLIDKNLNKEIFKENIFF